MTRDGERQQRLWAPWRIEYILAETAPGCVFCEQPAAGVRPETLVLCLWPNAFALLNRYPYINGHLLVCPRRHVSALGELPPSEYAEVGELVRQAAGVITQAMAPQGLNIGLNQGQAAGAGIHDHLHWHLVPRYVGDSNFMPAVADTRVVSQSLEASWRLFEPLFAALTPPDHAETWRDG